MDDYKMQRIYGKRMMNAKGYVIFWEEHVKKLPDPFALKMLEVAKTILAKTEKQIEDLKSSHQ